MDFALVLAPDGQSADLAFVNGDFALDNTLQTAVILSLLCDRVAGADDAIPDGTANRRGHWGDVFLPTLPDGSPDFSGSRLWLYRRCTATLQNANAIAAACEDALSWMIADKVAQSVAVTTAWASATGLDVAIQIARQNTLGQLTSHQFDFVWNATTAALAPLP